MFLNFSYLLCDAVSLGNWRTIFRNTLLTSYSTVEYNNKYFAE